MTKIKLGDGCAASELLQLLQYTPQRGLFRQTVVKLSLPNAD